MNIRTSLAAMVLLGALAQSAPAIEHMVEYAVPRGAGRGETVDVEFFGLYLRDPVEAVFYRPGIACEGLQFAALPREEGGLAHGGKVREVVTATLRIADDCPLGEHLIRIRTRTLLSEPVTFRVGPFPTVTETETRIGENDAPHAQAVDRNSTINGRILRGDVMDRDRFSVVMKKGERLSADLESVRLGTLHHAGENDCELRVFGPGGRELAHCDDTIPVVQDPQISLIVPEDGRYIVEVAQQMHTPGNHRYYRLHLGNFAIPTAVFPLGGRPGERLSLKLTGDAGGDATVEVTLPRSELSTTYPTHFPYYVVTDDVISPTPLPMRVTAHENAFEADAAEIRSDLPVAFNGTVSVDGEVDRWHFAAQKGQRLDVRVFARTLGTGLDSKIWIRLAGTRSKPFVAQDDGSLTEHDFWSCHNRLRPKALLDSVASFDVPADGEYVLGIEDTRGIGGPEHHYRIEVDAHVPGLHPYVHGQFAQKRPRETAFVVPRGNRWTINLSLGESLGTRYRGDIELDARGLPPGVKMIAPRFVGGLRKMPVQFVAQEEAELGTSLIQLVARSVDGSPLRGSPQQGFTYTDRRGGFAWHSVFVDRFALAVVDPAPFRLEADAESVSLARNGEITMGLRVIRSGGFDEPLELQADWLPPGVEKGPPVVVPRGESEARLQLRATGNASVGSWPLTITGTTVDGDILAGTGCRLVTTPVIELDVSDPYLSVTIRRAAIERGTRGKIVADLRHRRPFRGEATAKLLQLPHGVRLLDPKPVITATDTSCVFHVEVTMDALVGQYKEIAAEIAISDGGRSIRQQSGSGVLRVDPVRGSK